MGSPTTTTDRLDVRRDATREHVVAPDVHADPRDGLAGAVRRGADGASPRAWRATRARA